MLIIFAIIGIILLLSLCGGLFFLFGGILEIIMAGVGYFFGGIFTIIAFFLALYVILGLIGLV